MNISVCITVFNEEKTISKLLDSLLLQTKKPNEIIIVDNFSTDKTVEIIRHFQKKNKHIKLLIEKCTRGKGRNLGVEVSKNELIAMTDAGCIACHDWLEKISQPINHGAEVVAGFYEMTAKNSMQKAMKVFLGTSSSEFNDSFLPSTRSILFNKKIWEEVGGFPEHLNTAEDTVFNYKLLKFGAKISRVKNAVVEWGMPSSITNFQLAIYNYAKGDARSKIWIFPEKGLASHNIHSLFVLFRSFLALILAIYYILYTIYFPAILILVIYFYWSYRKAGLWGIILEPISDLAVITGFVSGII